MTAVTQLSSVTLLVAYAALGSVSTFGGLVPLDEHATHAGIAVPSAAMPRGDVTPSLDDPLRPAGIDFACGGLTRLSRALGTGPGPVSTRKSAVLQQLPEPPSSLMLGLTALAGLGLCHAGQTICKVHLPPVPNGYHAGGPQFVGHATPLDLDSWDLPRCVFDEAASEVPQVSRFRVEAGFATPLQRLPLAAAPRAPPLFSSLIRLELEPLLLAAFVCSAAHELDTFLGEPCTCGGLEEREATKKFAPTPAAGRTRVDRRDGQHPLGRETISMQECMLSKGYGNDS